MRIEIASHHLPDPQGSAAGRQLWALGDAARAAGHDWTVWCWGAAPEHAAIPDWCRVEPLPAPPRSAGGLARTVWRPREHIGGAWQPDGDAHLLADGRDSAPAVPPGRPAALVVHHSVRLDAAATRVWRPGTVQDRRAERRGIHRAAASAALSERVRHAVGALAVVPPTVPLPAAPLAPVEEPVALLFADFRWPPNRLAARDLLRTWPQIVAAVAGARLLLAGRGSEALAGTATGSGIEVLGEVADASAVMARAALLAFPCPPSSGPKLKVLDAVLHGLPVLTTSYGCEGLHCPGVTVADGGADFARQLVRLLRDPAGRAASATVARGAALDFHAPERAVSAWLDLAAAADGSAAASAG